MMSNTTFNAEIKEIINQMYLNQKAFILNVKDLSLLLVKDANNRLNNNDESKFNNNINERTKGELTNSFDQSLSIILSKKNDFLL
tara:strand:+ start:4122 stop:4376 length:255 start_codon:yes stop_codon:yes gene_type:complete